MHMRWPDGIGREAGIGKRAKRIPGLHVMTGLLWGDTMPDLGVGPHKIIVVVAVVVVVVGGV